MKSVRLLVPIILFLRLLNVSTSPFSLSMRKSSWERVYSLLGLLCAMQVEWEVAPFSLPF